MGHLLLTQCGYDDSLLAHQAQISMVGMSVNDLNACAAPPATTTKLSDTTKLLTYNFKATAGGFSISPFNIASINVTNPGSSCSAHFRVVNDKVVELHYSGDNDEWVGDEGYCVYIIRGCMRQPEPTTTTLNDEQEDSVSSFSSPPVAKLPYEAIYNTPNPNAPKTVKIPVTPAWLPPSPNTILPASTSKSTPKTDAIQK
ncbi:hypothetical protein [Entomobacter blattae]|uniref:hypothetical protein n=1 Tax=Entomobacter blattae TaxID=2762277 RepID=UPI00193B01FC|nr:hypothetical protein [Entomobacter blattae]